MISKNSVTFFKRIRDFIRSNGEGRKYPNMDGHIPKKGLFFKGNLLYIEDAAAHFLATMEGGILISRARKNQDYMQSVLDQALILLKK